MLVYWDKRVVLAVVGMFLMTYGLVSMGIASERVGEVNGHLYEEHVKTHPSQGEVRRIEGATARLLSTPEGVYVHMRTRELAPGHAYTLWLVTVSHPQACEESPCTPADVLKKTRLTQSDVFYADGAIAGPSGKLTFNGFQPAGKASDSWFGVGLSNPITAEVHLVVNAHGPVISSISQSMIGSYRGGCTDKSIPDAFPETARNDGIPGPNACKLVQDVIFMQSR